MDYIRGGSRISSYGVHLKKIAPRGGRHENVWGILCEKSRFYAKKSYFFNFRGGGGECAGCAPHWIRPCTYISVDQQFQIFFNCAMKPSAASVVYFPHLTFISKIILRTYYGKKCE
jgi:hypothetical protein